MKNIARYKTTQYDILKIRYLKAFLARNVLNTEKDYEQLIKNQIN